MGLRFRRSVKICKGVKVNFGKTGASLSVGTRGFHKTFHTSGKTTTSYGLPGTGLSYVETSSRRSSRRSSGRNNIRSSEIGKQDEIQSNAEIVEEFNDFVNDIRSLHKECATRINWIHLRDCPEPFSKNHAGPNERQAQEIIDNTKPSVFDKILKSTYEKKMEKLYEDLYEAKYADIDLYNRWKTQKDIATKVLNHDVDGYFEAIQEFLPFDSILDYGSDFDVGTDDPEIIEVEFHAKTSKVVPNHVLSLTQTGKLSTKTMTKTMHYDIAQDYICSCTLRVAREVFALLPVDKVVIHAVDTVIDKFDDDQEATVLSVLIHRDELERISFDEIDPSDTLERMHCNMNMKKTQGMKPVERIEF